LSEWLDIRGLDFAVPLALLSGAIGLCWTLPAAIIPIEALGHLGDAQKVSVLFFAVSIVGVASTICIPLLMRRVGRRRLIAMGVLVTILSASTLAVESAAALIAGTALRVIGFLCIDIVLEIVIMERIPRRNIARFEAVRMFSLGVGLIIGPWLGVWLAKHAGYWSPFVLLNAVIILVGFYVFRSRIRLSLDDPPTPVEPPNPIRYIRRFCEQPRLPLAPCCSPLSSAAWARESGYGRCSPSATAVPGWSPSRLRSRSWPTPLGRASPACLGVQCSPPSLTR